MVAFILRRTLAFIGVLWAVVTLTFLLIRVSPGSPFTRERNLPPSIEKQLLIHYKLDGTEGRAWGTHLGADLGLSESLRVTLGNAGALGQQYFSYLGDLLHGDLRLSTKYRDRSVNEILAQTLPLSIALGGIAIVIAAVVGIWLGCFAAVRRDKLGDHLAMFGSLGAISVPTFVTGPLTILAFGLLIPIFPVGGLQRPVGAWSCPRSSWPRPTSPTSRV